MFQLKAKIILAVFSAITFVCATSLFGDSSNQAHVSTKGTIYENHVGIFAPKARAASQEPFWGSGKSVTKPIFSVLDEADSLLGKTLHTKTYEEDNNDSFVTLEQEGAKLGYDF